MCTMPAGIIDMSKQLLSRHHSGKHKSMSTKYKVVSTITIDLKTIGVATELATAK